MELIPILSLIILVATVSTFILAVGAYILYKVRERKGTRQAPQPSSIPAELVAPTPIIAEQHTATGLRRTFDVTVPTRERIIEYERGRSGPEMRPTYVSAPPPPPTRATNYPSSSAATRYTSSGDRGKNTAERKKFLRYTNEGYVEPENERSKKKENKEDKLRWR